jgi:hypothetical protein
LTSTFSRLEKAGISYALTVVAAVAIAAASCIAQPESPRNLLLEYNDCLLEDGGPDVLGGRPGPEICDERHPALARRTDDLVSEYNDCLLNATSLIESAASAEAVMSCDQRFPALAPR